MKTRLRIIWNGANEVRDDVVHGKTVIEKVVETRTMLRSHKFWKMGLFLPSHTFFSHHGLICFCHKSALFL